jgi:hypothetical protein
MRSIPSFLAIAGLAFLGSAIALAVTQAPLGSPLFFSLAAVMTAAYAATLARVWREPNAPRRYLAAAFALSIAFRLPLMVRPVDSTSDIVRYLWDGRVQRFGLNPYRVVPADPALAAIHTDETRQMPSRRVRTPYPPGAQLFFRGITTIHESTNAIRMALVAADLITILIVWRWLCVTRRNGWLALAYAWNPLVVLEVAHSGHIDALGAMWIAAAAYWMAARRTTLASIAFVAAVAVKLLPIVLAPLFWRRVRVRDAAAAAAVAAAMALPFTIDATVPVGTVPSVIAGIRFNGPLFLAIAAVTAAPVAAALAVLAGLCAALWARRHLDAADPAAWAWPMAVALLCAPVIYPWYLLYFTPFLFSLATLPLTAWTVSVIPVYIVWHFSRLGGRWVVPGTVMLIEFAAVIVAVAVIRRVRNP